MKAYLIDAENQTIENIDVKTMADIISLVGSETIESDAVGNSGDRLFFDEECFLRGSAGRFQIDTLIPVSGKGIVMGSSEDGTTLSDVHTDQDDLRSRIKYLGRWPRVNHTSQAHADGGDQHRYALSRPLMRGVSRQKADESN